MYDDFGWPSMIETAAGLTDWSLGMEYLIWTCDIDMYHPFCDDIDANEFAANADDYHTCVVAAVAVNFPTDLTPILTLSLLDDVKMALSWNL